jgi:hypothetical protein
MSPFVKGDTRGIFMALRKISPNPSFTLKGTREKRGGVILKSMTLTFN